MKLLITGGCGFLGSNLASHALKLGMNVIVFDNLSRYGSIDNLNWLLSQGKLTFVHGDIRNKNDVSHVIKNYLPDSIFHLAGQVAMTTSINNPQMDFEVNVGGTFNLLETIRLYNPNCGIIYSSTNKVYGDLEQYTYRETKTRYECVEKPDGFDESIQLNFHSPYGCSKGAADQYMLDYARIFGLKTAVFRHSSMYGGRQFATYDQGWIGWFCQKALETKRGTKKPFTISGNGKQVRDVLHAEDMIDLYFSALYKISLLELFILLEKNTGVKLQYTNLPVRESDQKIFVSDITKIKKIIQWQPSVQKTEGIKNMIEWCETI
ncbi:GDP-mannose 4,6-dehydratase [Xenorhabdus siamensis]|uniref:GDP-mannose 4,6-dehydratase n=1 Tax=Xenorhabdus siamensis TaxID=3136254 RepID=UPI0030F40E40